MDDGAVLLVVVCVLLAVLLRVFWREILALLLVTAISCVLVAVFFVVLTMARVTGAV